MHSTDRFFQLMDVAAFPQVCPGSFAVVLQEVVNGIE